MTIEYITQGERPFAPRGATLDAAIADWKTLRTDDPSAFDRHITIDAGSLVPQVTWGTNPAMTVDVTGIVPQPEDVPFASADDARRALAYMGLEPGTPISEIPVDVVFIGSCTNGRIEDLRAAAKVFKGRKTAPGVQALVVPGSEPVRHQAEAEGLDRIFLEAGAEWRQAGCSMCLAMNPDKLKPGQRSASTSNRNFEGRQGPGGRTHLVSPAMAAAAAVTGHFTDVRQPPAVNSNWGISKHGSVRNSPRAPGPARLERRQHRLDHPRPLPEESRAHRLRPPALCRQALRTRRCSRRRQPDIHGPEQPDFPLNNPAFQGATVLVVGRNFGCGSSREHAVWAVMQAGYRAVIAPGKGVGFADIFESNAFNSGLLVIELNADEWQSIADAVRDHPGNTEVTIDLRDQTVKLHRPGNGDTTQPDPTFRFEIPESHRHRLLHGLDAIAETLLHEPAIQRYEQHAPAWLLSRQESI